MSITNLFDADSYKNAISTLNDQVAELEESIEDLDHEIDNFDVSDYYTESEFLDMLNESYGDVDICGFSFGAGDALERLDPTAFRCAYVDYLDSVEPENIGTYVDLVEERDDLQNELDDLVEQIESLRNELAELEEEEI